MGLKVFERIEVELRDAHDQKLENGDLILYRDRTGKDVIARLNRVEKGLVYLSNVLDNTEYKVRVGTLKDVTKYESIKEQLL